MKKMSTLGVLVVLIALMACVTGCKMKQKAEGGDTNDVAAVPTVVEAPVSK